MTDCQKAGRRYSVNHASRLRLGALVRSPRRLDLMDALCALLLATWLVAWVLGILHRYFDYDELEHFYAGWRIAEGARPFYDFFECHPPFLWYPLGLALRAFHPQSFPLFAPALRQRAGPHRAPARPRQERLAVVRTTAATRLAALAHVRDRHR